jgi:hypothetical protein
MNVGTVFAALDRNAREIESLIEAGDATLTRRAPAISAWSISEQLDHTLKVRRSIFEVLLSEPEPLPGGMNLLGRMAFIAGWIPRGMGKSPERLRGQPKSDVELRRALASTAEPYGRLRAAEAILSNPARVLPHPRFGGLRALEALRFTDIHDRHHLKLIRDIQR